MIGILSALDVEMTPLLEFVEGQQRETVCEIEFITGTIHGFPVVCAVCGVGKVHGARCAQIMVCRYEVEMIINIGLGGSLRKDLGLGDLVVAETCVQHDMDMSAAGTPRGMIPWGKTSKEYPDGDRAITYLPCNEKMAACVMQAAEQQEIHCICGVIATGDQFVANRELNDFLSGTFHAVCCEMEGGAVAQVCRAAGIDCAVIRAISDNADKDAGETYYGHRRTLCHSAPVVAEALKLYFA